MTPSSVPPRPSRWIPIVAGKVARLLLLSQLCWRRLPISVIASGTVRVTRSPGSLPSAIALHETAEGIDQGLHRRTSTSSRSIEAELFLLVHGTRGSSTLMTPTTTHVDTRSDGYVANALAYSSSRRTRRVGVVNSEVDHNAVSEVVALRSSEENRTERALNSPATTPHNAYVPTA